MGVLIVEPDNCVGCRNCVVACSVDRHSLSKDFVSALTETPRPEPRIRLKQVADKPVPVPCRHCEHAPCVLACPSGAMSIAEDTSVLYDQERCIKCFMCAAACPFSACYVSEDASYVVKCDLCPNRDVPACVDACTTRALTYQDCHPEVSDED